VNKKFVHKLILFLILLGPIGQFFIFRFTPLYDLNLFSKLYDNAVWVKGKPKVLIMGSSHARYHIIPSEIAKMNEDYEFQDIVNVGENAASPFEMYTTFMKNRKKFSDVEMIYYTLEPHMLSEKYYPYNKYEKILLSYEQWVYLEKNHNHKNSYFYPFQIFIDSLMFKKPNRAKTNGYSSLQHKEFKPFSKGKVSNTIYKPLSLFPVTHMGMENFKKLKDECDKNGIKFIFVLTPTYSWQKYYSNEAKKYDDLLVDLLNQRLGQVSVIGSFWPEDFNLTYQDFKDDTHLANSGALKFTKVVFKDISKHRELEENKIYNTFLYRFTEK